MNEDCSNRRKLERTSTPLWKDIEQDKKSLPLCREKEWKHVLYGANRHKMSQRYEKIDQNTSFAKYPSNKWLFWVFSISILKRKHLKDNAITAYILFKSSSPLICNLHSIDMFDGTHRSDKAVKPNTKAFKKNNLKSAQLLSTEDAQRRDVFFC